MKLKIPKFLEPVLLSGFKEFQSTEKDVTRKEELYIVARLVGGIHIRYWFLSEYTDFDYYGTMLKKTLIGFCLTGIMSAVFVIIFYYGLLNFIRVGLKDDELKILVLQAVFSIVGTCYPFLLGLTYFLQTRRIYNLIYKYMDTCKNLSSNNRGFYREQTLRLHFLQNFIRIDTVFGFVYHYVYHTNCFEDKDPGLVCGLFLPLWYPFVTNYFPVREIIIICATLFFGHYCLFMIHGPIDMFFMAELFEFKVEKLIKLMRETSLNRNQNIDVVRRNLQEIVDYHQDLHECYLLIKEIAGDLSISILIGYVPFMASLMTFLVTDFNIAHLDEFLVVISNMYMWCHSMQKIFDLGEKLSEEAFSMDWYEMDNRMSKDFIIFLMKLHQPMEISSMFFVLKKPIFLSMLKTMYSTLMLILNTT